MRTIAVGETIRRLISSLLLTRNSEIARNILAPLQIGVAASGGCEAAVHAVRDLVHRYGHVNRIALLQVDLQNTFNLVSRAAFLRETRLQMLDLYKWVQYCCGEGTTPELWVDHLRLRSVCGVQHENTLGPLLFALALQPVLTALCDKSRTRRTMIPIPASRHAYNKTPSLLVFYLDDGILVGRHEILQHALLFLSSQEAVARGLHFWIKK